MSDGPSPRGGDRDPSDARSLRPLSLSLAADSPSRTLASPTHAPLLISSPSKIRAQQQMTLSAIPEAAPVTNEEQQQQQQYAASAASASAAAASAIAAAASPFESHSASGNGGLLPLSPSQPHSPSVAAPDGSVCTTPVSTSAGVYPRAGTLARSSTTPDSASGPGSAGRATLGVPSAYGTLRVASSGNGLTPAAAMGSRQPSAPTTPAANPRLLRPLSSSRSAHSSPAHGGNGTLPPMGPGGTSLLRRPSVSLLPSAGELGSPDVSLSRAPSANGAVSALGMPVMHEPSAFARPDAMISYSRKDIAFVRLLYQHFENAGRSIWVDFNNIPKAVDFMESIRTGIRESNSFIYIISPDSVSSKYCDLELDFAIECGKRIVPVVVREVVPVEKVRAEVQQLNWIFCCTTGAAAAAAAAGQNGKPPAVVPPSMHLHQVFPHILDSVLIDPQYVLMHTKLLVRAMEWEAAGEDASFLATGRELEEANRWVARSNAYALHHRRHAERLRAQAQRHSAGSTLRSAANAAALVSAPMPTRIQKLFIFASNERVLQTHKKEQMLLRFLEDDDDEEDEAESEEGEEGEDGEGDEAGCGAANIQDSGEVDDTFHAATALDMDDAAGARDADGNRPSRRGTGTGAEASPEEHVHGTPQRSGNQRARNTSGARDANSFEHGSLAARRDASSAAAAAAAAAGTNGALSVPRAGSRKVSSSDRAPSGRPSASDLHGTGTGTPSRSRNSSGAHHGSGGSAARPPRLASTHTPLHRVLPHLSAQSRFASYHKGGALRHLLHTQEELMQSMMDAVAERERQAAAQQQRQRQDALAKQLQVQFDAAAGPAHAQGDLEAPPLASVVPTEPDGAIGSGSGGGGGGALPPSEMAGVFLDGPGTPGVAVASDGAGGGGEHAPPATWSHRLSRARFSAFTLHESAAFHLLYLAHLAAEALFVFLVLVLVLSGAAGPGDLPSSHAQGRGATDAIRPLRVLLAISLSFSFAELALVALIHWGPRRLAKQHVYLGAAAMLIAVAALDAASWHCRGLQQLRSSDPAFGPSSCANNALVWSMLLRSWAILLRGVDSLTTRPLRHSLHSMHVSLTHARGVVSKLKRMVRILNGEIIEKENVAKRKWEMLKRAHPSRRFSQVLPPGAGIGAGTGAGLGANGISGAQGGFGAGGAPQPGTASSSPARVRGAVPGYSTLPRNSNRGSTISPGAYSSGGAAAAAARMYTSRRSVLLQSPSGHANKYDTMPLRKTPAAAQAIAAVAAAGTSARADADAEAAECPPPSVGAPAADAEVPSFPVSIHVNGDATHAANTGATASAAAQPPLQRECSDSSTPFMLQTPPRGYGAMCASAPVSAAPSCAPSPIPSPSAGSQQQDSGDNGLERADSDRAPGAMLQASAAGVASAAPVSTSAFPPSATAGAAPARRKTHRHGGRRGAVPRSSAAGGTGATVIRVHPDPSSADAPAAGVRAVCFPDGSAASASLASQALDSGALFDGLTESPRSGGGSSSVLSGLSALSSGLSMDVGAQHSAPVSPAAAAKATAGADQQQLQEEEEDQDGDSTGSAYEEEENDGAVSVSVSDGDECEDDEEEEDADECEDEDDEDEDDEQAEDEDAEEGEDDEEAEWDGELHAESPSAATLPDHDAAVSVSASASQSAPLASASPSSRRGSASGGWPAPVQLVSPPGAGASLDPTSGVPDVHSAPADPSAAASAASADASALALTTPPSVFSPRSAPSCTPIDDAAAQHGHAHASAGADSGAVTPH